MWLPGGSGLTVAVRCPPPRAAAAGGQLLSELGNAASPRRPLELERLLAAEFIRLRPAGNATPFERFLTRPAVEPVLTRRWADLVGPLDLHLASEIVGDLTGAPARPRGRFAASAPDRNGVRTVYAGLAHAEGWIDRIAAAEGVTHDPFARACHAYAEVALSHPFADGNGRLARVLLQRSLARSGMLGGPLLPLGPLIYRHHRPVIQALVTLGTTGRWGPFMDLMDALCGAALTFTERALAEPDGSGHVGAR
jgi:hypothetical protein